MDGYLTGSGPLLPPPSSQKEDQPRKYRLAKRPRTSHRTKSTATDENLWFTKTDTACQTDTSHTEKMWMEIGRRICELQEEDLFCYEEPRKPLPVSQRGEEVLHSILQNMKVLKERFGEYAKYTIFRNVVGATAAFASIAKHSVSQVAQGTFSPESKKKTSNGKLSKRERQQRAAEHLGEDDKEKLIGYIRYCWKNEINVSIEHMVNWARNHIAFPFKRTVMGDILGGLNLCFRLKQSNPTIEERLDLIFLRTVFLKRWDFMKAQNYYIVCQDETWFFAGMTTTRGWQYRTETNYKKARLGDIDKPIGGPKKGANKGQRGIIEGMLSEDGIIAESLNVVISKVALGDQKEDYHKEMNAAVSEKWIVAMLPIIKKLADDKNRPAALMLDNAPYHCRAISKPPTGTSKKEDIKAWLSDKKVQFSISDKKPVLLAKMNDWLQANGGRLGNTVFYLDTEGAKHGVEIIRTPPYHCFFNPIELFWARLKAHLRTVGKTSDKLPTVRDRVVQFCKNFPATDSAALYRHVDKYVDEILEIIAKKEAAKCSVPTSSTSLGGDSESEAEIVGDSTFDDDSESEYTEEDF